MQKITTFLSFSKPHAEEAAKLYCSLFDGRILETHPGPDGKVFGVSFELFGQRFNAMNGGEGFSFANGTSLFVSCENQAEIDRYYDTLLEGGGKEMQCGWVADKFGVIWQIVPKNLPKLLEGGRAFPAMMKMNKLDIATLERARDGK